MHLSFPKEFNPHLRIRQIQKNQLRDSSIKRKKDSTPENEKAPPESDDESSVTGDRDPAN